MTTRSFITRKEIAAMLEVSVDTVIRNEERWGIVVFRRNVSPRQVDYHRQGTVAALAQQRLLPQSQDASHLLNSPVSQLPKSSA